MLKQTSFDATSRSLHTNSGPPDTRIKRSYGRSKVEKKPLIEWKRRQKGSQMAVKRKKRRERGLPNSAIQKDEVNFQDGG